MFSAPFAISLILFAIPGCSKKNDANAPLIATEMEDATPTGVMEAAHPPEPKPLSIEAIDTAKELVETGTSWSDTLSLIKSRLGQATTNYGREHRWATREIDRCAVLSVQRNGATVRWMHYRFIRAGSNETLWNLCLDSIGTESRYGTDGDKTAESLRKAAEQGHAEGQFNLGVIYQNGKEVKQDNAEAVKWYRKAAEQGHDKAQTNLGTMFLNGEGIMQDDIEAFAWFDLAENEASRLFVAKRMTSEQIERAQRLSKELEEKFGNHFIQDLNSRPAPKPPQVTVGEGVVKGSLDKMIIRRYIRRKMSRIRYCYEKELLLNPGLNGTVNVSFEISAEGLVAKADAKGFPEVSDCVAEAIRAIRFPKPKGIVIVTYPFNFKPSS